MTPAWHSSQGFTVKTIATQGTQTTASNSDLTFNRAITQHWGLGRQPCSHPATYVHRGLKGFSVSGGKLTAEPVSADECPTRKPLGTGYTSVEAIQHQDRFLHATSAARILPPFFDVGSGRQRDAGSNAEGCCNGDTFHQTPHTDSTSSEIQQEAEARKLCLALQCLKPPPQPPPPTPQPPPPLPHPYPTPGLLSTEEKQTNKYRQEHTAHQATTIPTVLITRCSLSR